MASAITTYVQIFLDFVDNSDSIQQHLFVELLLLGKICILKSTFRNCLIFLLCISPAIQINLRSL